MPELIAVFILHIRAVYIRAKYILGFKCTSNLVSSYVIDNLISRIYNPTASTVGRDR